MGGGQVRVTQQYESDPCEKGSIQARIVRIDMLRTLANTAELHNVGGYHPFEQMKMSHNGNCWVIELESTGGE